ncbi:MAG: hypothetical protein QOG45_1501 [Chloroflexota bacterium]|jgi:hypothetical protein|nr:hypothetical protein [Chloroflexota bacterium]
MTVTHTSAVDLDATRLLAERYAQAWNEHDLDAIMSMHGSTSTFHPHVRPYYEADAHGRRAPWHPGARPRSRILHRWRFFEGA